MAFAVLSGSLYPETSRMWYRSSTSWNCIPNGLKVESNIGNILNSRRRSSLFAFALGVVSSSSSEPEFKRRAGTCNHNVPETTANVLLREVL